MMSLILIQMSYNITHSAITYMTIYIMIRLFVMSHFFGLDSVGMV